MADFSSTLKQHPLIAILRGITTVLIEKKFTIIEIPLHSPNPIESITLLANRFGDDALIGAGTVTDTASVRLIAEAGGKLVVMPNGNKDVVQAAKGRGLTAIPGIATPTEAFAMIEAGADALKLFPAEGIPPTALKAMKAVLPDTLPILPVGGITPERMVEYQKAGASGFGLGSALYKPGMSVSEVEHNANQFNQALILNSL